MEPSFSHSGITSLRSRSLSEGLLTRASPDCHPAMQMQHMHTTCRYVQPEPGSLFPRSPRLPSWVTGLLHTPEDNLKQTSGTISSARIPAHTPTSTFSKERIKKKCCRSWETFRFRISMLFLLIDFSSLPQILSSMNFLITIMLRFTWKTAVYGVHLMVYLICLCLLSVLCLALPSQTSNRHCLWRPVSSTSVSSKWGRLPPGKPSVGFIQAGGITKTNLHLL